MQHFKNIKVVSGSVDSVEFLLTSKRSEVNRTDLNETSKMELRRTQEQNWKFSFTLLWRKRLVWKYFKMKFDRKCIVWLIWCNGKVGRIADRLV
jgi:hypothetical protein